ncbi:hypothetical protein [Parvicella tangerina]|uniref:Uncharacterized protein n=1 Tax=Parvicella tangerina TaxID=2829795 RepID=A0A916NBL9_9FLAO|nr:hypothetical protein [Parvicella tangerina]CAG5081211.1 hypothetical protein CRYO30217_01564 [Parvicella tangerina]
MKFLDWFNRNYWFLYSLLAIAIVVHVFGIYGMIPAPWNSIFNYFYGIMGLIAFLALIRKAWMSNGY